MKYIDALKVYNKDKDKWCMPKKGTEDYLKIKKMMINDNNIIKNKKILNIKKVKKVLNIQNVEKIEKVKKVKKVQNVINNLSTKKYSKSLSPENKKRSSVFISQIYNKKQGNKIAKFLKNKLIDNKYTLDNRIAFYNYVNKLLVGINNEECLEEKLFSSKKGYTIKNILNLVKIIGTESCYGVIYLSSIVNSFGGFTIASKVMPATKDNIREIMIMETITENIILKKRSKHFVMMYKYAICNKNPYNDKNRIVCINELAHGDIDTLMVKKELLNDDETIINLLFQTFISIGTFHNWIGYVHRDTHGGNFLYQKNKEKGYYKYLFDGNTYYLKSCEYNVMIYDFGLSKKIKDYDYDELIDNKYIPLDYVRICHIYMNKIFGWGKYNNLPSVYVNKIANIFKRELLNINYTNQKDFFKNIIEKLFIPYSPKGMWLTVPPSNIINKIEFDIG